MESLKNEGKSILALSPHPDDAELGAGGFILNELSKKGFVKIVYFYKEKVISVTENSSKLNYSYEFFSDSETRPVLNNNSVARLDDIIYGKEQYDYMLIPHYGDSHQDHKIVNELAIASSRKFTGTILQYEISAYINNNKSYNPNVFVGMDNIQDKLDWCNSYWDVDDNILESTRALAILRSANTNYPYAESFELLRCTL